MGFEGLISSNSGNSYSGGGARAVNNISQPISSSMQNSSSFSFSAVCSMHLLFVFGLYS